MLSRVANSVYWLNRYVERAENVARVVDVNLHLTLDLPEASDGQWGAIVATTGDEEEFRKRHGPPDKENVIRFLTFDPDNPNSILSCLHRARENARTVREIVSSEVWEQVNRAYLHVRDAADRKERRSAPHAFFQEVKEASHLFAGIMDATMSHGEAWHFCHLGRMLERADQTSRIVDVKYYLLLPSVSHVGSPIDDLQWSAVLKSCSALEMYRKQRRRVIPADVVAFLLLDREFPRSIRYSVTRAEESLRAITGSPPGEFRIESERLLGQLRSELEYARVHDLLAAGLHEHLDGLQRKLNRIGDTVRDTFFSHAMIADGDAPPVARLGATQG